MSKFGEGVNGFRFRIVSFIEEREETSDNYIAVSLLQVYLSYHDSSRNQDKSVFILCEDE